MQRENPKHRIETRQLSELRAHPHQAELFPDLCDGELEELAADIKRNGLAHPVEILPDGTIIAGHQRVRAARMLRWKTISCWVREDLHEAGPEAVEERLITDNLLRRQLDRLGQARLYRELLRLNRRDGDQNGPVRGDLRDFLADQFGVSGRTLDRWEKLLDCPREVQDAYARGELPLITAGKVADLPEKTQRKIAQAIRDGGSAKQVVASHLHQNGEADSPSAWRLFKGFLRGLEKDVDRLGAHCKSFDMILVQESDLAVLKGGQKLVARLIHRIEGEFQRRKREREEKRKAKRERWEAFERRASGKGDAVATGA
jgi:ParB-like chromosome segregation protein Spo0J